MKFYNLNFLKQPFYSALCELSDHVEKSQKYILFETEADKHADPLSQSVDLTHDFDMV